MYDAEMNPVIKISYDKSMDNTIDVSQFEKQGYRFEGIYDMNRDVMLFNAKGFQSPMIIFDSDYVGVLKYSPIAYQLVFDAKEGALQSSSDYIKNISYGEQIGFFPAPILEGMDFDGWFDENGTRFSYGTTPIQTNFSAPGYTLTSENIKLYAQYTEKYCNVRLIYQDGTNDIRIKVKYGDKLPDMTEYFKDNGSRVITGFGVSPNASSSFNDSVYTDLELYALWKDYKNISFVYSESEIKLVKVYREGNMAVLPDGERSGYIFDGWYSSALLSGNKITSVPFGSLADKYYAKWSLGNYTIKFVADGIVIGSDTFNIEDTDIFVPPVPVKKHYTAKWEDYKLEFKDMIVNAVYEPEEMKLTLMVGADYSYHTVKYGEMYQLPVPVKKGCEFKGWYYKGEPLTDKDGNSRNPYSYEAGITLTAEFVNMQYKLYFESNGGSAVDTVSVEYGKSYALTQKPTRNGFYFAGWFDSTMVNEYIGSITITQDTIVYAKWIKSTPIYDAEDLNKIAANPSGNYHLVSNINMKGADWTPIETFSGILNGNGYRIYNFNLRNSGVDLAFIIRNEGTIKDISFSNIEISDVIENDKSCSVAVVCAYNAGRLTGVSVEKVSMLVNISNHNINNNLIIGGIVGENSGSIISCSSQSELTYKESFSASGTSGRYTTSIYIGGIVGKNTGEISDVVSDFDVDVNEYLNVQANRPNPWTDGYVYKTANLHIGGISGAEYGTLSGGESNVQFNLYSNAEGGTSSASYYYPERQTYVGGAVGCVYENGVVENCCVRGSATLTRVGVYASSYNFATGGIVGKADGGTVNNCASDMTIKSKDGYAGMIGGTVGYIMPSGKVSNVAYYGNITVESFIGNGGYIGGLAGRVDGMLTKGYFHGTIQTDCTQIADIVGYVETTGTVSKAIGNGNSKNVFFENKGASKNNIIIDKDYGADILYSRELLFDDLCLFESDIWSIDDDTGLYLISFPEQSFAQEANHEEQ